MKDSLEFSSGFERILRQKGGGGCIKIHSMDANPIFHYCKTMHVQTFWEKCNKMQACKIQYLKIEDNICPIFFFFRKIFFSTLLICSLILYSIYKLEIFIKHRKKLKTIMRIHWNEKKRRKKGKNFVPQATKDLF